MTGLSQTLQRRSHKTIASTAFDPEGDGYDYETAVDAGITPDADGHWSSRDPRTGMLLKGRTHPTFSKGVAVDEALGYRLSKRAGRYYTTRD